jgi:hypothetical protein
MLRAVIFSLLFVAAVGGRSWGPWVTPTKGEPWPKPQKIVNYGGYVIVRPTCFTFEVWNGIYMGVSRLEDITAGGDFPGRCDKKKFI